MKIDFKAKLEPTGPNGSWCFIYFPGDIEKTFGAKGRIPVAGTINGFQFRSSFMTMGGEHRLCVNKEMQVGAKAKPGDTAHFVLERDDKPRTVTVPLFMKKALAKTPRAMAVFDKLSYSHRKEYVQWVSAAKQSETVQRRLEKLVRVLLEKADGKK